MVSKINNSLKNPGKPICLMNDQRGVTRTTLEDSAS